MITEKQREKNRRRYEKEWRPAYDALIKCYPLTLDDLDGEVWKPVVGYGELYYESNYGRTKSFCNGKVKILKPALNANGYLSVQLYFGGEMKSFMDFIPNPEDKPQVNHRDGHPMNCFVGNLEWATASENIQHAHDTGLVTNAQGEDHSNAKLTNEQVVYIRENPDDLTGRELAEQFGVAQCTISDIQLGKVYKNAGGNPRKKQKSGEYHRIPDDERAQILADWETGNYSQRQLARQYGVSQPTIWNIIHASCMG